MALSPLKSALTIFPRDRVWLRAQGSDALRFLNGMWTCDFKRLAADAPACSAGYLLDAKGKTLAFGILTSVTATEFLIGVERPWAEKVRTTLEQFLIADDVHIEIDARFASGMEVPTSPLIPATETLRLLPPVPTALDAVYRIGQEPWGWRLPRQLVSSQHEEFWVLQNASLPAAAYVMSEEDWAALRVKRGVPEWGRDISSDALVLEFPFEEAVSFHKGCYIGQEVVARATSRGKMVRTFARFHAEETLREGFVHSTLETERPVGKITTVAENQGLGLIRLAMLSAGELYQEGPGGRIALRAERIGE